MQCKPDRLRTARIYHRRTVRNVPESGVPLDGPRSASATSGHLRGWEFAQIDVPCRAAGERRPDVRRRVALSRRPESDGGGWIAVVRDSSTVGSEDDLLGGNGDSCSLGLPGHDPLTGLPDRRLFERLLTRALERLRRHKDYIFAVCFIDLDGFKGINDRFGHLTGDRVLCEVARRLVGCVRPGDMAARFGGDEFTVLIDDVPDNRSGVLVARRMLDQIRQPMAIEAGSIRIGASIGVAIGAGKHQRIDQLLTEADRAMYRVKSLGGDGVELIHEPPSHRQIKPR